MRVTDRHSTGTHVRPQLLAQPGVVARVSHDSWEWPQPREQIFLLGYSHSLHHYTAGLRARYCNNNTRWVPVTTEDLAKYLLWNVIFVNFGSPSHLFGWVCQPMSFKNSKSFLQFLKSDVVGNGEVQEAVRLFVKQVRGSSHPIH